MPPKKSHKKWRNPPRTVKQAYEDPASIEIPSRDGLTLDRTSRLTPEDLDILKGINPTFKKHLDKLQELRARRKQIAAQRQGGFDPRNPLKFIVNTLGWKPTPNALALGWKYPVTPQQLRLLASVVENKRTAVTSGHAVGKTKILAAIVLWCLFSMEDTIVVTTATSWTQVEIQLWAEIRDAFRSAKVQLPGKLLTTELSISDKWFAIGMSTDNATRFQGLHSKRVVVVFDEATGVREELWEAAESMIQRSSDRFIAVGNPTQPQSRFHRACLSGLWNVIRFDAREHPNVMYDDPEIIPGAVTREWVNDRLEEYGGEDSPLFQARVAGIWPTQGEHTLIPAGAIEEAQLWDERKKEKGSITITAEEREGSVLGADVAGEGSDLFPCTEIYARRSRILWAVHHRDIMESVGRLVRTIREREGRVQFICIDDTAIGLGVSSRLLELQRFASNDPVRMKDDPLVKARIIRVNFASAAELHMKDRCHSIKDQLWWQLAEDLKKGLRGLPTEKELASLHLPKGNSLVAQLAAPIYELDSKGRIKVWDKRHDNVEKTKSLPAKSPDLAHSLMLANHAYRKMRPSMAEPEAPARTILEVRQRDWVRHVRELQAPKEKSDDINQLFDSMNPFEDFY